MELQKEVNDTQKVIQDSTDKYENIDLDNLNEQIGNVSGMYSVHERCQVSNMIVQLQYKRPNSQTDGVCGTIKLLHIGVGVLRPGVG